MAGISRLRNTALPVLRWLGSSQRRSYGAAAASQVDYDYDYDYDYEDDEYDRRREVIPATETEPAAPARGVQWVFMGNPAPKKRVYAERLSKLLEVPYISMGNLVRQELEPRSSLYKQIVSAVNEGKLVPEDIIFGLLSKRLEEGYGRGETGFILDGIPRTQIQAEILDQIADIDLVVNFKCTEGCLVSKHCGNGLCAHCQESLGMGKCGSSNLSLQLQQNQLKSTSMENAKMEKLRMYAEQRKPLEDYYRKQKKLIDVEVARGAGETWQGLLAALHLQHMNAVHPSHKLTA